ncbi:hydrogenase maturation nickel metallochaperone HypA [Myxococcota bacterium]|nr:hydrogenase maturation nickel metallochaperone HypA [Myxococcota bacterium]
MHETSLAVALFDQLDGLRRRDAGGPAAGAGPETVRRVEVCVGAAAGVEPVLFVTAFEALRDERGYAAAELALTTEAALWRCPTCGHEDAWPDLPFCPACDLPLRLVRGEALRLDRVEFELATDPEREPSDV